MNITGEFIALLGTILGTCGFLWKQSDNIRKEIATVRENFVKHSVCIERRKDCIKHIEKAFNTNHENKE